MAWMAMSPLSQVNQPDAVRPESPWTPASFASSSLTHKQHREPRSPRIWAVVIGGDAYTFDDREEAMSQIRKVGIGWMEKFRTLEAAKEWQAAKVQDWEDSSIGWNFGWRDMEASLESQRKLESQLVEDAKAQAVARENRKKARLEIGSPAISIRPGPSTFRPPGPGVASTSTPPTNVACAASPLTQNAAALVNTPLGTAARVNIARRSSERSHNAVTSSTRTPQAPVQTSSAPQIPRQSPSGLHSSSPSNSSPFPPPVLAHPSSFASIPPKQGSANSSAASSPNPAVGGITISNPVVPQSQEQPNPQVAAPSTSSTAAPAQPIASTPTSTTADKIKTVFFPFRSSPSVSRNAPSTAQSGTSGSNAKDAIPIDFSPEVAGPIDLTWLDSDDE